MEGAVRRRHFTLRDKDVQHMRPPCCRNTFASTITACRTTVQVVFHVLFFAAATLTFDLRGLPATSRRAVRRHLAQSTPGHLASVRRITAPGQPGLGGLLAQALKNRKKRQRLRLAFDLTLIPYHGKPETDEKEIYRSKAKDGTSHFHAYASAYIVLAGERFTVALTSIEKNEKMEVVTKRLMELARKPAFVPSCCCSTAASTVSASSAICRPRSPLLDAGHARGRKPTKDRPATGIRAFQLWKKGGWGTHTLLDGKKRQATVRICVYCGNYRGQWKRHGRFAWVYAFWGFQPGGVRWVADLYRLRFGIETSYRQMKQAHIKTSSRSPLLRFLFVAIALLLRNVWVWIHWEVLSSRRRGRRQINLERLRFKTLLFWLLQVAIAVLGIIGETPTEREIANGV